MTHPIGAPGSVARMLSEAAARGDRFTHPFYVFAYGPSGPYMLGEGNTRDEAMADANPGTPSNCVVVDVRSYGCGVGPA